MSGNGLESVDNIRGTLDLLDDGYTYDNDFGNDISENLDIIEEEITLKDRIIKFLIDTLKLTATDRFHGYDDNYYMCVLGSWSNCVELTKEQYDLLKGVCYCE